MHVLDFAERPEYIAIARYGLGRVFAGAEFAHCLIGRGLFAEVWRHEAQDSDLVIYFSKGTFKHTGCGARMAAFFQSGGSDTSTTMDCLRFRCPMELMPNFLSGSVIRTRTTLSRSLPWKVACRLKDAHNQL